MNENQNDRSSSLLPESTPMMLICELGKMMCNRLHEKNTPGFQMQRSCRLLLIHLAYQDGRTQLELVNATHLKPPTVSVTLHKMEQDGLVIRRQDRFDLRAVRVFLTDKGREIEQSAVKTLVAEEKELMKDFTKEEVQMLLAFLNRLKSGFSKDTDTCDFEKD